MRARVVLCIALAASFLMAPRSARAGDPYLEWWTIATPHFRVHYHGGIDDIAQRIASIAERAHDEISPQLGFEPSQTTDIVLTDDTDSANGSATTLPYNTIRLFVTAPDDMSPLNDYDDWHVELVSHEYTHILHIDNTSGLPLLVNDILGKTYSPNQAQPRWVLEGLAVAMESEHTSAGRLRSTLFDMYLRADVLEGRLATLDEISQDPRRWPSGDLWYLYGAKFIEWILQTYGEDTFARVANEYGSFIIPWGINRAIRRATGSTYPELYAGWKATLEAHYSEQAAAIRARGLREGERLTYGGRVASRPRFVPDACTRRAGRELVYYRDDGEHRPGYYRVSAERGHGRELEILSRASGTSAAFAPDCSLVFDSVAPSARRYFFSDLFRLPAGVRAPDGADLRRERLTTGERAREPDVSPDGRSIVYVTNDRGTTTLRIAELDAQGHLKNPRRLVASARFEQAFTPRFSPDGRRVAYSAWTRGGYRDVRVVDVASGSFFEVTHDRAIDQQPAWAPDGKTLFFVSDRSGVSNVYAYDLDTARLAQVTNVVNGAYMPDVSSDGKTLVYVGYTSAGFDVFSMELERARYLEAPAPASREDGSVHIAARRWPVQRYSPLTTLRPRAYSLNYGTGTFGNALTVSTQGADAVGLHAFTASATLETGGPEWRASFDYDYARLPFDFRASAFRNALPRSDYRVGDQPQKVTEHTYGSTMGVSFNVPDEFDAQSLGLSFTVARYSHDSPFGNAIDPWSPVPTEPSSGIIASAHAGYFYSNAEGSLWGISAERGFSVSLGADFADPAFGSSSTLAAFYGTLTTYALMPWARHHVLALAASGGSSGGSYPRRGLFVTGGFADQPAVDVYTSGIRQSAFVLRGFDPGQFYGNDYALLNAEYRFPIAYVDRGVSTLPVFLRTLSGTLFSDWGGAFNGLDPNDPLSVLHLSVGGELWTDLELGYRLDATLRLGVAHGFGSDAHHDLQTYFVAASAF